MNKHGVDFEEAKTVLNDPFELTVADPEHSQGETRFVSVGKSETDRLIVVSYTERIGDRIRIIGEIPRHGLSMADIRQRPADHDTVEAGNDASDLVVVTFDERIHRSGLILDRLKNRENTMYLCFRLCRVGGRT